MLTVHACLQQIISEVNKCVTIKWSRCLKMFWRPTKTNCTNRSQKQTTQIQTQTDQSAIDEISKLTTGSIPLSSCKNTWTRGRVRYPQRRIKYHCIVWRRLGQNQFYTSTIQTQNQFNTDSTPPTQYRAPIIWYQLRANASKQTNKQQESRCYIMVLGWDVDLEARKSIIIL